jgi:aminoglycoside phosphotransferase family enzyme/predicted kinase
MIMEDQRGVVTFLTSSAAYGGAAVERIDTHSSIVFLAGDRAWKLKRAVRYAYLDYSTADRRRAMCEAEVRINRRTAPELYRGVTAVTRAADGTLAIDGAGTPIDWLVEMTRFDQSALFDRLAEAGLLPLHVMEPLARVIAKFHRTADGATNGGGWEAMRRIIDDNGAGFREDGAGILEPAACAKLTERARFVLDRGGMLLDQRRDDGLVRHCHGDLHLRNVLLLDGAPTLFDAVEFNDEISSIDVLYDLAFVLMDLWRRGLPHHANVLLNAYLSDTEDLSGLSLMPLFLSCRAAVMAKTTATAATLCTGAGQRQSMSAVANEYLTIAAALLEPPPPRLIAIGGLSGSGKSTLARDLAPSIGAAPGAVVIRSDEIRKRLCGLGPLDRLGPDGYTDAVTRRVYGALMARANEVVRAGQTAIADAVFARPADRDAIQRVAKDAGVPFIGLWLEAPAPVLMARLTGRRGDASDAGVDVLRRQLTYRLEPLPWARVNAAGTRQQLCDSAGALAGALDKSVPSCSPP